MTTRPTSMPQLDRRLMLQGSLAMTAAAVGSRAFAAEGRPASFGFGLVTYMWGAKWDLPTLLKNCEAAKVGAVELRTTHNHGVEPSLSAIQRKDVAARFADTDVQLVGLGSNERFDNPDPAVVAKAIEASKKFIVLSHDVGGGGVKVKPDRFHQGVPHEKTIEQIGNALNTLGEFAAGYGQEVRLEVHGQCNELPTIRKIMDVATNDNVVVCWNCNPADLEGAGLKANFNMVADRLGRTTHIRALDNSSYPTAELMKLLIDAEYVGWLLLEEGKVPPDPAAELVRQAKLFEAMRTAAQG